MAQQKGSQPKCKTIPYPASTTRPTSAKHSSNIAGSALAKSGKIPKANTELAA